MLKYIIGGSTFQFRMNKSELTCSLSTFLQEPREGMLLLARSYVIMQKVNIALEMVATDLEADPHQFGLKKGNFWRLVTDLSKRTLDSLYVSMMSRGFDPSILPVLQRTMVPAAVRCMVPSDTGRDLRDAVVLKDVAQISRFIKYLVQYHVHQRRRRHRNNHRSNG